MTCTIHLRVDPDLVGLARVMRLFRRNAVVAAQVDIERVADREIANVRGTMTRRRVRTLAAALLRVPEVIHAAIFDESKVLVEFSRKST